MTAAMTAVLQGTPAVAMALAGMLTACGVLALCSATADLIRMFTGGKTR